MDLDKMINEANRLLELLTNLDPEESGTETETEVTKYDPDTGKIVSKTKTKTTQKPEYEQVQSLWIHFMEQHRAEDTNAQDNNCKEDKTELEKERLNLDKMKFELEQYKTKLEEKRLDLQQEEVELKKDEAEERKTYTKKQAAWEITKIIAKGSIDILGMAVGIGLIVKGETTGCLIGGTKAKFLKTRIG